MLKNNVLVDGNCVAFGFLDNQLVNEYFFWTERLQALN